ncbi:MFS transporter [Rhodoligotrophos ferricapiens]|uniref:MFS transporter n=1 Tax=Rhodoligotrophos ferricapiens TaxID=3069264 RepID=UPI00315C690A
MTTAATTSPALTDDRQARRNALLLAAAQALYSSNSVIIITTGGLIGSMLAPSPVWATVPVSAFVVGTATSTVPASLLMGRVGRRSGFLIGALIGMLGAFFAAFAIYQRSFALFCLATLISGSYQAFGQYYRFAAADTASPSFRPRAIAWVMIGGIISAFIGPFVVMGTRDLLAPVTFAGCYLASAMLAILAMGVLAFLDIPLVRQGSHGGNARPLPEILKQPRLIVAIIAGMMSFGMMNFVMTSTPLAMVGCGFSFDAAAWVIQWHVLAMYVPSFFTGRLISRFGAPLIVAAGMVLLAGAGVAGLTGISFGHFSAALILLGIGWNFGFVGATTMVTDCYQTSERSKVQAVNDFAVFTTVALSSLSSGQLLSLFGWEAVTLSLFPMVGLVLVLLAWLWFSNHRRIAVEP